MRNMKNIIMSLFILAFVSSCDEKELSVLDPAATISPVLSIPSTVELSMDNETEAVSFSWTAASYNLDLEIGYLLQIDQAGNSFADAYTLYNGNQLSYNTTVKDLNTAILNKLGLSPDEEADVEFRVLATISEHVESALSTSKSLSVTPYATVFPPIYMIGAATGGWDTALAVEVQSSAPNVYSTIWKFTQNEAFRFFAQPDWNATNYNYPYFGTISNLFENAGDGDSNFRFLGETGWYQITVNMKTLAVDIVSVPEPLMFMTGAGIGGWDTPGTGASIKMTFVKPGVFTATADFVSGEAWRFFAQADWSPTSYSFPYFANGTIADMFENAGDGDSNFRNKSGGTYVITLNMNDLSISVAAP